VEFGAELPKTSVGKFVRRQPRDEEPARQASQAVAQGRAEAAPTAARQGRFLPSASWLATHSSATIAAPSESSPHSTVAATISANFRTLSCP
jgi:hypothetical protein